MSPPHRDKFVRPARIVSASGQFYMGLRFLDSIHLRSSYLLRTVAQPSPAVN